MNKKSKRAKNKDPEKKQATKAADPTSTAFGKKTEKKGQPADQESSKPHPGKTVQDSEPMIRPESTLSSAAGSAKQEKSSGGGDPISLKESGRFWSIFIAIGVIAWIIIQSYGYFTGWGNTEKLIERHFNHAQRLSLSKRYPAAIREYQKVINMENVNSESKHQAMVGIADLYRENKEWQKAIQAYEQLRGLEEHTVMSAWAGLKLAESQVENGQAEQAIQTYGRIRSEFPNSDWDAEARLGQGHAYQSLQQYEKAIELYRALEKDYHGGFLAADALVQIGRCYERQGKKEDAQKTYTELIHHYPETMTDEAQRRLKHLKQGKNPLGIRHWDN